jgi:sortase A
MPRWVRISLGLFLLWGALGVLGYRMGWIAHFHHAQDTLLRSARATLTPGSGSCAPGAPGAPGASGASGAAVKDRQLTGVLALPALGVDAPVAEGTGDDVLNVAVGHASSTPLPGQPGTSVLLAHDVSYFAHIDQLKAGDAIRYSTGCGTQVFKVTGHTVVRAGAPVPALAGNGLVLDTCWPTNALWFTPNRYLVEAVQQAVGSTGGPTTAGTKTWATGYRAPAPPALAAQGLDLAHNEVPMGTLQLTGRPDPAWAQSPAPLGVEAAALQAYFGAERAAAQRRADWWVQLAPGVAPPPAVWGAWVSGHGAPLDVRVSATAATPTAVVLDTVVQLAGGSAPGSYHEVVTEAVRGLNVVVTKWEVDHA